MATAIADGLRASGTGVKLISLDARSRSEVITDVLCAGALVVGSPTINNQMYPVVADALCYIKGLRPKNLLGAAFGLSGGAEKRLPRSTNSLFP